MSGTTWNESVHGAGVFRILNFNAAKFLKDLCLSVKVFKKKLFKNSIFVGFEFKKLSCCTFNLAKATHFLKIDTPNVTHLNPLKYQAHWLVKILEILVPFKYF